MNNKAKYLSIGFVFFFTLFIYTSCKKKEEMSEVIPKQTCPSEELGNFNLLPSSFNAIPYKYGTYIHFEDSAKNQRALLVDYTYDTNKYVNRTFTNYCEFDSTTLKEYKYGSEHAAYELKDSVGEFGKFITQIILATWLYQNNEDADFTQYDDLIVIGQRSLHIIVAQRGLSDDVFSFKAKPLTSLDVGGKTFEDVYVSEGLNICYNYKQGLVAFRDPDGKMWTLK